MIKYLYIILSTNWVILTKLIQFLKYILKPVKSVRKFVSFFFYFIVFKIQLINIIFSNYYDLYFVKNTYEISEALFTVENN